MNILTIDASTEILSVALSLNDEIFSEQQPGFRQHAQLVLPMIERLMRISGLEFNELDGIAFGRGPGSFTGLRIACSVAKALAYAHSLPVYPVSTLGAIAYEVKQTQADVLISSNAQVLAVIDARMHQLYWGLFDVNHHTALEQVTDASLIACASQDPIILAGVGFDSYLSQLTAVISERIIKKQNVYPNACSMVALVQSGQVIAVSAKDAIPSYIRNQVTHGEKSG